jgi:dephospho-CoA kinase
MGCGKSMALGFFESLGLKTLSADAIAKNIYETDVVFQKNLQLRFGEKIIQGGKVDFQAISKQVFGDLKDLEWLEDQLHPKIHQHWQFAVSQCPGYNWVIEIPLLFEKKLEKCFNFSICVACSEFTQQKRLEEKGYTLESMRLRFKNQWPMIQKIKQADVVFWNESHPEALKAQIIYWTQLFITKI